MNVARRIAQFILIIVVLLTSVSPARAQSEITFKEIATIGRGAIEQIEWSPDGTQIAVVTIRGVWIYQADDLTIEPRLIDVRDRRPKMFGRQYPVSYPENFFMPMVVFDSKWDRLAVTEYGGGVNIFDMATGEKLVTVDSWTTVDVMAFSSDGRTLAFGRNGGVTEWSSRYDFIAEFLLIDVATGKVRRNVDIIESWPDAIAFSPDDRYLVVSGYSGVGHTGGRHHYIVDLRSDSVIFQGAGAEELDESFANGFPPPIVIAQNGINEDYFKVGFASNDAQFTMTHLDHNDRVFVLSPDLTKYAAHAGIGNIVVKEVGTDKPLVTYSLSDSFNLLGAFSRDGSRLAVSNETDKLIVWVLSSSTLDNNYEQSKNLGCPYFDEYCATSTTAHEIVVGALGLPVRVFTENFPGRRFLSPDRQWGVLLRPTTKSPNNNTVNLVRQADGQEFQLKLRGFSALDDDEEVSYGNIQDVYFDTNSSMVAVAFSTPAKGGTYNDFVRVWKIDGQEPQPTPIAVLEVPGPPKLVRRDPNTGLFYIATLFNSVYIWDSATNKIVGALNLPSNVLGMEFSTSDGILVTRSGDGLIRLWATK